MKYAGIRNITDLVKKASDTEVQTKILDFLKENPSPSDEEDIHNMADKLKVNKHHFEESIYKILGGFLSGGKSKGFDGKYDEEQLRMGIEVEQEHVVGSGLPEEIMNAIAKKIAQDHLAEFPDYYTRLAKMEKEAEKETEGKKDTP